MRPCPLLPSQSLVRRRIESWDIDICFAMVWGEGLFSFSVGLNGLPGGRAISFLGWVFPPWVVWFHSFLFSYLVSFRGV